MKLNKKTTQTGSSMNEHNTRLMESYLMGQPTFTIKDISALNGPKAERTEALALASVLGKSLTERNDKTYIFSQAFADANYDRILELIRHMNQHCAFKLAKLRTLLTDDQKQAGMDLAIYNEAYHILNDRLSDTALDGPMIREKMRSYGFAGTAGLKFECTVKLGGKKKHAPSENGWKVKNIDGVNWYVKNADTIGAKAVPAVSDEARTTTINFMNDLESRYNAAMAEWETTDEDKEEALLEAMEKIYHDEIDVMPVEIFELSPENVAKANAIADKVEGWIRNGR